jgi:hypothetical protein
LPARGEEWVVAVAEQGVDKGWAVDAACVTGNFSIPAATAVVKISTEKPVTKTYLFYQELTPYDHCNYGKRSVPAI